MDEFADVVSLALQTAIIVPADKITDGPRDTEHIKDRDHEIERLKLMYSAWMDEYKALRAEITQIGNSSRQVTQVAIVALAALISLGGYIVQNDLPIIYLIAPFLFYCLAWIQLRIAYLTHSIGKYIHEHIAEGVRCVTQQVSPYTYPPAGKLRQLAEYSTAPRLPLEWDVLGQPEMHSYKRRLWIIEASSVVTPLFTAAFVPLAYVAYVRHYHTTISVWATAYILANEALFFYTLHMGLWVRRYRLGEYDPDKDGNPKPTRRYHLLPFQLMHWVREQFVKAIVGWGHDGRVDPAKWYTRILTQRGRSAYRLVRFGCWLVLAGLTIIWIRHENAKAVTYAKQNMSYISLQNGPLIKGVVVGYDGRNVVVTDRGDRMLLDYSLIRAISKVSPRGKAP